jgi:hypothetical protein
MARTLQNYSQIKNNEGRRIAGRGFKIEKRMVRTTNNQTKWSNRFRKGGKR